MTFDPLTASRLVARVYGLSDPDEPLDVMLRRQRQQHYCQSCKHGEHAACDGFNADECNTPDWSSCHGFCSAAPCQCQEGEHPGRRF